MHKVQGYSSIRRIGRSNCRILQGNNAVHLHLFFKNRYRSQAKKYKVQERNHTQLLVVKIKLNE